MAAKPLTKAEKEWLSRLQSVLNECPSDRLGAYTMGDQALELYDTGFDAKIHELTDDLTTDFCQAVLKTESDLGSLSMPFPVHSTSG